MLFEVKCSRRGEEGIYFLCGGARDNCKRYAHGLLVIFQRVCTPRRHLLLTIWKLYSIVIDLNNCYFSLIYLPSCYWTVCYRTVQ